MLQSPDTTAGAVDSQGFPLNDATPATPLSTATDPNANKSSSWIDSIETATTGFFTEAKADILSGVGSVESGVSGAFNSAVTGVEDAYSGVKSEVAGAVDFSLSRILLIAVVIAGGLYFIGKSGVVGQAMSVG